MVTYSIKCNECSAEAIISIGQVVIGPKMAYFESTRCSNCNMALEADDDGLPPNSIRYRIIESTGRWGLLVSVEGPKRIDVCKILHSGLKTTMAEVSQMKNRMPGVVYSGTRTEMEWLCNLLSKFGIGSSPVPHHDDLNAQSIDIGCLDSIAFKQQKKR